MISADDIDTFQRRWGDSMKAADEAVRRAEKGLPDDRLFDGSNGALLAMRGVWAKNQIIAMQSAALLEFIEQEAERNAASMEATADPMRT